MSDKIKEWLKLKKKLEQVKQRELDLRNEIIEERPGAQGTTNLVEGSYKIKITRGVTRSIDPSVLVEIVDDLSDSERACISYTPKLDAKGFSYLPKNNLLSRAVIIKPSQPTLEVEFVNGDD